VSFYADDNGPRTKPLPARSNLVHLADVREREDNGRRLAAVELAPAPVEPDPVEALMVEVADLAAGLRVVDSKLAYLSGALPDDPAFSLLGRMAGSVDEVRERLPELRAAIRDVAGDDAA
jgi:hypothetical protein